MDFFDKVAGGLDFIGDFISNSFDAAVEFFAIIPQVVGLSTILPMYVPTIIGVSITLVCFVSATKLILSLLPF